MVIWWSWSSGFDIVRVSTTNIGLVETFSGLFGRKVTAVRESEDPAHKKSIKVTLI
jgi:hypothetical protein